MSYSLRFYQPSDIALLRLMMHGLYTYHPDDFPNDISDAHIDATVEELSRHPDRGEILLLEESGKVLGYALLVYFWSNEYGGKVVILDEFFISEETRGKGAGTWFLDQLHERYKNKAAAMILETMPDNERALHMYKKAGFEVSSRVHMVRQFAP